jgi:hypothetical protein
MAYKAYTCTVDGSTIICSCLSYVFFFDNSIGKKTGSPEAAFITFGLGSWISINSVGPAQWRSDHFPTPVSMSTRQNKWNPRSICQGKCHFFRDELPFAW